MDKPILEAATNAISNAFQIDFEFENDRLKDTSFQFVECVLADTALKGALNDILDRNIEE